MHVCHATLRGLTMNLMAPDAQFAGASATMSMVLTNNRASVRHGIGLAVLDATPRRPLGRGPTCRPWDRARCRSRSSPSAAACTRCRRSPPKPASRSAPSGSGRYGGRPRRCWSIRRPSRSRRPCRPASRAPAAPRRHALQNTGEFDGVRAYRRGDPLKLVVWKKAAKADELVSRDTQQAQRHELWLDFAQAGHAGPGAQAVAPGRVGAAGRPAGPGLRLAPARPGDQARRAAKRTSGAAWRRWRYVEPRLQRRSLPRDSRDTLFLLLVIGWVVLPQVGNLPLWCTRARGRACWSGAAGSRCTPGRCPAAGGCSACWSLSAGRHPGDASHAAGTRRRRDADRGAAGAEDAGAARPARHLRHLLPGLLHDAHELLLLAVAGRRRPRCWWRCWACSRRWSMRICRWAGRRCAAGRPHRRLDGAAGRADHGGAVRAVPALRAAVGHPRRRDERAQRPVGQHAGGQHRQPGAGRKHRHAREVRRPPSRRRATSTSAARCCPPSTAANGAPLLPRLGSRAPRLGGRAAAGVGRAGALRGDAGAATTGPGCWCWTRPRKPPAVPGLRNRR